MVAVPIELQEANAFVERLHRHHPPVHRDKFRIGCLAEDGHLAGVVQLARPVARCLDDGHTIEVVRLCSDGTKDVCSFLYGRAARIAHEMGYARIITYILDTETGTSLKASGWKFDGMTNAKTWNCPSRPRNTNAPTCAKQRWVKTWKGENDG